MVQKIYEKVAEKCETTSDEVKNEMQKAIDLAYPNGDKPTVGEFIAAIVDILKEESGI